MHTTSLEPGTLPDDQSAAVSQRPSLGPVHESVHSGSAEAPATPRARHATSDRTASATTSKVPPSERRSVKRPGSRPPMATSAVSSKRNGWAEDGDGQLFD